MVIAGGGAGAIDTALIGGTIGVEHTALGFTAALAGGTALPVDTQFVVSTIGSRKAWRVVGGDAFEDMAHLVVSTIGVPRTLRARRRLTTVVDAAFTECTLTGGYTFEIITCCAQVLIVGIDHGDTLIGFTGSIGDLHTGKIARTILIVVASTPADGLGRPVGVVIKDAQTKRSLIDAIPVTLTALTQSGASSLIRVCRSAFPIGTDPPLATVVVAITDLGLTERICRIGVRGIDITGDGAGFSPYATIGVFVATVGIAIGIAGLVFVAVRITLPPVMIAVVSVFVVTVAIDDQTSRRHQEYGAPSQQYPRAPYPPSRRLSHLPLSQQFRFVRLCHTW